MRPALILLGWVVLSAQTYLDPAASTEERVADILTRMTLDEKIGQMTQAERYATVGNTKIRDLGLGSILSGGGSAPANNTPAGWADMYDAMQSQALQTRLGIPLIYGIDAVHGHSNLVGAVLFPHNIGLGATGNADLVRETQRITALEVAGTGIDWTFSPCIAVPRDERWGRTYEGFSETPGITEILGKAAVEGLQGDSLNDPKTIAACAKHYLGDGGTTFGRDQGNTEISEAELRAIHLPGYEAAIEAGVATIMASFNSWNGIKLHGHQYLMTDVLKEELGFRGFIVSDWEGIQQITGDYPQAVKQAINAGIDMVMAPGTFEDFIATLRSLVDAGEVPLSRIDDAVSRILTVKFDLGLFEKPLTDRSLTDSIGIQEHRDVARQAVRESMVVLKKENGVLPLSSSSGKILVAGSHANDLGNQCGGWSISWQGSSGEITLGTTILEGLQQRVNGAQVLYDREDDQNLDADVAVIVVGETPYAEGSGDDSDLHLDDATVKMIRGIKQRGIPTLVVLISGRPMIVDNFIHHSDVLIAGWLPGTEGAGISDILFGDYEPSGKLTHSWPRSMSQVPINWGDANYDPLYEYQHGYQTSSDFGSEIAMEFQSAELKYSGDSLEIALDRPVASADLTGFQVVSGSSTLSLRNMLINPQDSHNLILILSEVPEVGEPLSVSYTAGLIEGLDGSSLAPFSMEQVYDSRIGEGPIRIPGRVEAEDYTNSSGVQVENTTDVGGGENVGWIDAGDWMDYNLLVTESGKYDLGFRVAALSETGLLEISSGDTAHTIEVEIPVTGGWQTWGTLFGQMYLEAGEQTLTLNVLKGGFNVNWIDFSLPVSTHSDLAVPERFTLSEPFPNPFNPSVQLSFLLPIEGEVALRVLDIQGKTVLEIFKGRKEAGRHQFIWNASTAPSGVYLLQAEFEGSVLTEKSLLLK